MNRAIEKIHEFQRFGSVLGLERMNNILSRLGNPEKDLKVIHVAGTNGKGSICKYIYEVLQAGGFKTGLYTSPFLEVFNERIQFNGEYISDEDLSKYTDMVLEKARELTDEGEDSPTEFEIITAIAILYFKEKKADYVVLEVGLGGKGDSTNVIEEPLCSIIASISMDHTDRLGNTISEIASEKAGIIKKGCPVITTCKDEEALKVISHRARSLEAKLYETLNLDYEIIEESLSGSKFKVNILGEEYPMEISMVGAHQVENAIGALYALCLLRKEGKINIRKSAILEGFKKAIQIGRFEVMRQKPYVIIDGAHNPDGAKALAETTRKSFSKEARILMVIGILADKDVNEIIDSFMQITKNFVITEPNNTRRMAACELDKIMHQKGGNCCIIREVKEAVSYALKQEDYDLVLFAGSLYLIGEIRGLINGREN